MKNFSPESLHAEAMAKIDSLQNKLSMGDFFELKVFIDYLCIQYKNKYHFVKGLLEELLTENEKLRENINQKLIENTDDKMERLYNWIFKYGDEDDL
jgi:hypothetical protein